MSSNATESVTRYVAAGKEFPTDGSDLETVDEFTSRAETRARLAEYHLSDPSARYYLSSRPCKSWNA